MWPNLRDDFKPNSVVHSLLVKNYNNTLKSVSLLAATFTNICANVFDNNSFCKMLLKRGQPSIILL